MGGQNGDGRVVVTPSRRPRRLVNDGFAILSPVVDVDNERLELREKRDGRVGASGRRNVFLWIDRSYVTQSQPHLSDINMKDTQTSWVSAKVVLTRNRRAFIPSSEVSSTVSYRIGPASSQDPYDTSERAASVGVSQYA